MSKLPSTIGGLSPLSEDGNTPTSASPARGRETRNALLQKLLPPPLVHAWDFWHEKPRSSSFNPIQTTSNPSSTIGAASGSSSSAASTANSAYDTNLSLLHSVTDVRHFWTLFNNFSFAMLPPKTSVHLFHKSVLPIWEHPRNERGGAWTFKFTDSRTASEFFRWIALLAISEQLQEAVTVDPEKEQFRDDICGVNFIVKKTGAITVQLWTRDAENELGIQRVLECVQNGAAAECVPRKGDYFYKRHKDHPGFKFEANAIGATENGAKNTNGSRADSAVGSPEPSEEEALRSARVVEAEFEKVRRRLETLDAEDAAALAAIQGNSQ